MPRPKKGDPELNLVSFCDIVTVICVALFMAMIVVVVMIVVVMSVAAAMQADAVGVAGFVFVAVAGQAIFATLAGVGEADIASRADP